jgi:plasmid stabilization system protein ParE
MRIKFHPAARAELRAARNWYNERSPLSAFAFAQTVSNAISRIREAPNTFPLADHGTRNFVLQRFPFNIFYRTGETEIVLVAVAHQKRRPGYWSQSSDVLTEINSFRRRYMSAFFIECVFSEPRNFWS